MYIYHNQESLCRASALTWLSKFKHPFAAPVFSRGLRNAVLGEGNVTAHFRSASVELGSGLVLQGLGSTVFPLRFSRFHVAFDSLLLLVDTLEGLESRVAESLPCRKGYAATEIEHFVGGAVQARSRSSLSINDSSGLKNWNSRNEVSDVKSCRADTWKFESPYLLNLLVDIVVALRTAPIEQLPLWVLTFYFAMSRSNFLPKGLFNPLRAHIDQLSTWELLLLAIWLLVIAVRRTFERAPEFFFSLLEESLERFEDAEDSFDVPVMSVAQPCDLNSVEFKRSSTESAGIPSESRRNSLPTTKVSHSVTCSVDPPASETVIDRKVFKEEGIWQDFFRDPNQWWDNRFDKRNPRAPDFRHKLTRKALWISGKSTPDWVRKRFLLV